MKWKYVESPLLNKSLEFATQIVLFYEEYAKSKRDRTIAKKLLRSATSVGENINEAIYDNSIDLAEEIKRMLISSINTAKKKQ